MCPGFPKFEYYKEGRFPIPQGGHQPLLWRLLSVRVGIHLTHRLFFFRSDSTKIDESTMEITDTNDYYA